MLPLILATIGQILKKWQQFFEIQDGGDHHFEFLKLCISDVIDMIQIEVSMFSQIFVKIGQIVKNWQQIFEIQYGVGRHLELWSRKFVNVTDVF